MWKQCVVGLAVLALGACGDDDDDGSGGDVSADEQPYVDAMIASFEESEADELQLDREQAECIAPRWVDIWRVERLREAGIEPEDFAEDADPDLSSIGLTEAEGGEMYDAFAACDVDVRELFVESFGAEQDLSAEDRQCISDAFPDDLLRRIFVVTFVEGDEALDQNEELTGELLAVFSQCPGAIGTD